MESCIHEGGSQQRGSRRGTRQHSSGAYCSTPQCGALSHLTSQQSKTNFPSARHFELRSSQSAPPTTPASFSKRAAGSSAQRNTRTMQRKLLAFGDVLLWAFATTHPAARRLQKRKRRPIGKKSADWRPSSCGFLLPLSWPRPLPRAPAAVERAWRRIPRQLPQGAQGVRRHRGEGNALPEDRSPPPEMARALLPRSPTTSTAQREVAAAPTRLARGGQKHRAKSP